MPRTTFTPGTFVRIPLADGSYGYGRLLDFPYAAFYDFRTEHAASNLDEIALRPVLFLVAVHKSILETWEIIGKRQLEDSIGQLPERFMQDVSNFDKCKIVDCKGNERPAKPEECVGLERVAVWEADHVEERLLDTFMGRLNPWVESLKVRLQR
jgi:hypothetical protein